MIPAEAFEAAHAEICEQNIDDCLDPLWRGKCVKAVEAAAPHLLGKGWSEGYLAGLASMQFYGVTPNPYRSHK